MSDEDTRELRAVPSEARLIVVDDGTRMEASQGSAATSNNVRVAQQIVNQAKAQIQEQRNEYPRTEQANPLL